MLCLACGEEMRLVQVTRDTTMPVSGYEHHTWQCSTCSTVEQRMTFPRRKTSTQTELLEAVPVEATHTRPVEPIQALPVEPSKTVLVEPTQLEPTHPDLPAAIAKTNAWAK